MPAPSRIVVIGGSAGGIESAAQLLGELPPALDAAVFLVIHVPSHGPSLLADVLQRRCRLPVMFARNGMPMDSATVYVAPPGRHLMLDDGALRTTFGPKESRARPSIDVLFRSAAMTYGSRVIAVVLSGTLDDGTAGAWAVKDRGGCVMVENPKTALFSGMVDSVLDHVEVDASLPLAELAERIVEETQRSFPPDVAAPTPPHWELEDMIAREGNGFENGSVGIGKASHFACPECGGVLSEIHEGSIQRYRCHTGHAYSSEALLAEIDNSIYANLWSAVRATEERVLLLRQLAAATHDEVARARFRDLATRAEDFVATMRRSALDPSVASDAG
jgi:two-component system chemotaxis response regulator CheB